MGFPICISGSLIVQPIFPTKMIVPERTFLPVHNSNNYRSNNITSIYIEALKTYKFNCLLLLRLCLKSIFNRKVFLLVQSFHFAVQNRTTY